MVNIITQPAKVGRKLRKPIHTFQLKTRPFQIQPFVIAPVLPGETLKNAMIQSRTVTQPIKNGLVGWWNEYYLFYVPHRALAISNDMQELMLQPAKDLSGLAAAALAETYHYAGVIDYASHCLTAVVDEFFRDEGEESADHLIGNLPAAKLNMQHWMDSVKDEDEVPGYTPDNAAVTPTPSTLDDYMLMFEHMRALNMVNMSYEDWLATYGVKVPRAEKQHLPELLRYVRDWSYPVNTVEPTTGVPASAVSWATQERADKDRLFKEPGFLFGVTVCRPKVYLKNQRGSGVHMLDTAFGWMPALMRDEPFTSLRKYATTTGPLNEINDAYWVDMRDLYLHGDQFLNFDPNTDTDGNTVDLPLAASATSMWYPSATDVDALFVGSTAATRQIRQDGICTFHILGTQEDNTPVYHTAP